MRKTPHDKQMKALALRGALDTRLHGSGWDGDWTVRILDNGSIHASIGYHAMDVDGGYDGWLTVNAVINPDTLEATSIYFTADRQTRRKHVAGQDGYYKDEVHNALRQIADDWKERESK